MRLTLPPLQLLRLLALAVGAGATGCGGAPVCSGPTCEAVCAEAEAEVLAAQGPGSTLLTPYEALRLRPLVDVVEAGVQLKGPALQLCQGDGACFDVTTLGRDDLLPRGTYDLVGTFDVPKPGTWALKVTTGCRSSMGSEASVRTIPLPHVEGGTRVTNLASFTSPSDVRSAVNCRVSVHAEGAPHVAWNARVLLAPRPSSPSGP